MYMTGLEYLHSKGIVHGDLRGVNTKLYRPCNVADLIISQGESLGVKRGDCQPFRLWAVQVFGGCTYSTGPTICRC